MSQKASQRPAALPVAAPSRTAAPAARGATLQSERRREARAAYLFILPTFIGFFTFIAGPLLAAIYLSFTQYDVISPPSWIGADNYGRLLTDRKALTSFKNTCIFVALSVAIEIVLALLLAVGVQRRMPRPLRYFFRTSYFLPIITSGTAIAIIFSYLFNTNFGVVNYYLTRLGFDAIPWITSTQYSLYTVVLGASWQRLGFTFILFAAGLQNIPRELYEAAELDGAVGWTRLRRITIPLLSPTILFATVIGIISSLQVFELPQIMTGGGPGDSSRTAVMVIVEERFRNLQFGYASALSVVLFLCIMLLTIFQFWLSRRWVHYR